MNSVAAPSRGGLVSLESQRASLSYRSTDMALSLSDNRGREVHVAFSTEQLDYNMTYDRFGAVKGGGNGHANGVVDKIRQYAGEEAAKQFQEMRGGSVMYEREEVSLSYEAMSFEVSGDVSLLQDFFSSENTAQRIFDFATGLGAGIDPSGEAFGGFMDQIREGIAQGFEMAEAMLGDLPQVSEDTRELLQLMLDAFEADPQGGRVKAADYLGQLAPADGDVG